MRRCRWSRPTSTSSAARSQSDTVRTIAGARSEWTPGESAGISRHGEGDENALRRRSSYSRWPRVMRWRSVRAQRSVDRGRAGGAIEPRNSSKFRVPTLCQSAEGNTAGGVIRESLVGPARSEIPGTHDELHAREPGDPVVARGVDDAPSWMVRGVADQRWRVVRGTLRR